MGIQSMKDFLHLVKRLCLLVSNKDWGMQEFCCCPVTASDKPPNLLQLLAWVVCCQLLSPPWRRRVPSASWEKWLGRSDLRWGRMEWLLYSHLYSIYGIGQSKGFKELSAKLCGSLRLLLKSKSKEKSWLWGLGSVWSASVVSVWRAALLLVWRSYRHMLSAA